MPNCRSIPPEAWEHARKALVMYFSRRHGSGRAEDLAQETLATLWRRGDFEFDREEDFLRVCYAFAKRISHSGYRDERKHSGEPIDAKAAGATGAGHKLSGAGLSVLLEEVIRIGERQLSAKDWEAICSATGPEGNDSPAAAVSTDKEKNALRVRLFRARKKLAELTGWKSSPTV